MKTCGKCGGSVTGPEVDRFAEVFGDLEIVCGNCVHDDSVILSLRRYYWGVLIAKIAAFKKWTPTKSHGWVKVTFAVPTTKKIPVEKFETIVGFVRDHCWKFWGLHIPPRGGDDAPLPESPPLETVDAE